MEFHVENVPTIDLLTMTASPGHGVRNEAAVVQGTKVNKSGRVNALCLKIGNENGWCRLVGLREGWHIQLPRNLARRLNSHFLMPVQIPTFPDVTFFYS